jgi:hypothetical protein
MTAAKSKLSIHVAVMGCVERCSESDTPYACLGDFLESLAQIGWGHEDIQAVGAAVLPLLAELNEGDTVSMGTAHAGRNPAPSRPVAE